MSEKVGYTAIPFDESQVPSGKFCNVNKFSVH